MQLLEQLLQATILFATPLLVAAIGELIVERAGVVNIGIEGMMLCGALAAWAGNAYLGPAMGVVAAVAAAVAVALAFAVAVLLFSADQIVTGTGVNLLALGLTGMIHKKIDPIIAQRMITGIGPMWMTLAAGGLIAMSWAYLRFSRGGLELTAVGHAPAAADAAGVAVNRVKLAAIVFGAACAGLAGAYLSTMRVQGFVENMTEGQGFLALAIVIFGRWSAPGVLSAGLFFGLVRAGAQSMETRLALADSTLQLLKIVPYAVSLAALAGLAGKTVAPGALGEAYARE